MIRIGLTGGIGMGKSTTAALFADVGLAVWDADAAVHRLYAPGGAAVKPVSATFSGVLSDEGGIDRQALSAQVIGDAAALKCLETIVHPLVAADRGTFLEQAKVEGLQAVVLDIPLLFENASEGLVDHVVVVSTDAATRRARVLARPGMTTEKLDAIIARQTPDEQKRAKADTIIDTGKGVSAARQQVLALVRELGITPARQQPSNQ